MNRFAVPMSLFAVLLVACQRPPPAEPVAPAAAATPAQAQAQAADAVSTAPATGSDADWQGYGAAQLGIDVEQLRTVWGSDLQGDAAADGACYYLSPAAHSEGGPFFMVEGGRFLRYDVRGGDTAAPGGGRIGMDLAQLQALYPQAEPLQPHKYVEGGKVLRVPATDGSQGALVFELGADGKATTWRVGLPPQVDYVEGCG